MNRLLQVLRRFVPSGRPAYIITALLVIIPILVLFFLIWQNGPSNQVTVFMTTSDTRDVTITSADVHLGVFPNSDGIASVNLAGTTQDLEISSVTLKIWDQAKGPSAGRPPDVSAQFQVQAGQVFGSYPLGSTGSLTDETRTYEYTVVDNRGFLQVNGSINTRVNLSQDSEAQTFRLLVEGLIAFLPILVKTTVETFYAFKNPSVRKRTR